VSLEAYTTNDTLLFSRLVAVSQIDSLNDNIYWTLLSMNTYRFNLVQSYDIVDWYLNGTYVTTAPTVELSLGNEGYNIIMADVTKQNCKRQLFKYVDIINSTDSPMNNSTDLTLFPNPTEGYSMLKVSKNLNKYFLIEIFDITGKLIQKINLDNQDDIFNIKIYAPSSGIYILKIHSNRGVESLKLIKN